MRILCRPVDAIGSMLGAAVGADGAAPGVIGVVCAQTGAAIVSAATTATPFKRCFMGLTFVLSRLLN